MVSLPNIKIQSRALKYGYSNARVRGMKGLLLKAGFLDELIRVRSTDAMVELLQRTGYKEDLVSLSLRHKGSSLVELASSKNFNRVAKKIKVMAPRDDQHFIEAMLRRWDILNLKTLLNGLRLGRSYDSIKPYLFAVGSMDESDLERIGKAQDILSELRKTDFGRELLYQGKITAKMRDYFKTALKNPDSFTQLQAILDGYSYIFIDKITYIISPLKYSN